MKHLCILILTIVICSNASFISSSPVKKIENPVLLFSEYTLITDSLKSSEESLIPLDSIVTVPGNELIVPKDTTNIIQTELPKLPVDTIGLIQKEPQIIPTDSTGLIQNDTLTVPTDSTGLIQPERIIPGDSIGGLQPGKNTLLDSLNINKNLQKDTIPRIIYRSVYADSIEQGNPNFFPKNVIEIKWISEKRDTVIRYKNILGINTFYGVYTYGLGFGIFKRLSNDADFIANINLSYVFDRRTVEDIDTNSNILALDRESRLYPIVFNVGLEKYFMQNRIDWKIKPVLIFGFAPAIIITTPYQLTFFKSLKKIQLSYGVGVFAALGFDWQAFNKFGINLTARYSFIPVLGKEIYYYKGFLVKNVGGFYVNLGVTLLQEYFSKN
jgi:hypothetical protein